MRASLHAQGTGRFTRDAVYATAKRDLQDVAAVLADRPFLLGDRPTTADATVFGFLANFLCEHARSPLTEITSALPTLPAYVERMRVRAFPDYPSWVGVRRERMAA